MGRCDRDRWTRGWQQLFATHRLVHNRREIRKIAVTHEADCGLAVVVVDTFWRDQQGRADHWCGASARSTRGCPAVSGMHTGVLAY